MTNPKVTAARGAVVHRPVERVLKKLGEDISYARRVRKMSTADFSSRIGVSRATLHRLESGDPSVGVNTLAMALHALGRLDALAMLADPMHDDVALNLMRASAPQRIGRRRKIGSPETEEALEAEPREPDSKFVGF